MIVRRLFEVVVFLVLCSAAISADLLLNPNIILHVLLAIAIGLASTLAPFGSIESKTLHSQRRIA